MERDSRRRANKKRRIIADAGTCRGDGGAGPTSIVDVPDELLELVLLRVRTPFCLFRAAAACKLWRRVIKGDGFLHRLRSLRGHNSHLLLGHYSVTTEPHRRRVDTAFVPSPRRRRPAIHLRRRVSLDFLTRHGRHELSDSRGGLLAFVRDNRYAVVCDPWTRQHRELRFPWRPRRPPSPDDDTEIFYKCIGVFFLDGDAGSGDGPMSSFRVLCAYIIEDDYGDMIAQARVFSARDGGCVLPCLETVIAMECIDTWNSPDYMYELLVGRAGGCVFWAGKDGHVLVLDESTFDFSIFMLPLAPDVSMPYHRKNLRVVAGGGGAGTVRIARVVDDDALEVLTARRLPYGSWECSGETGVEGLCNLANIEFKPDHSWCFVDTATTAALVIAACSSSSTAALLFSVDVETMVLRPVKDTTTVTAQRVFPYELPWPQTI
ncbi:hypothetical protein BS78_08G119600 [Paspalum vaginatum]|nr:hypothetical protein BS78_08G119600 [Paspalum vaginatum]